MKLLPKLLENQVYEIFPKMTEEDLFEDNIIYDTCSISVFQNWNFMSENVDLDLFTDLNKTIYFNKVLSFLKELYNNYSVYSFFEALHGGRALLTFSSEEEYLEWVDLSIKERLFLRLIIPELKVIINGGYDYTLPTFLTKDADITLLEKIVREHGLYILK